MTTHTEPEPKSNVTRLIERSSWEATSLLNDVRVKFPSDMQFDEVLSQRRTRRVFEPVTLRETRGFIKHLFTPQKVGRNKRQGRFLKSFISSGALHPIDVLIVSGPDIESPVLFLDERSKFVTVSVLNPDALKHANSEAQAIQPTANGHLILLAGDRRIVSNHYSSSESLLWRDAGAALQTCSMAATAYGYAFCPLGPTGRNVLTAIGPPHGDFIALGMAVFGR